MSEVKYYKMVDQRNEHFKTEGSVLTSVKSDRKMEALAVTYNWQELFRIEDAPFIECDKEEFDKHFNEVALKNGLKKI